MNKMYKWGKKDKKTHKTQNKTTKNQKKQKQKNSKIAKWNQSLNLYENIYNNKAQQMYVLMYTRNKYLSVTAVISCLAKAIKLAIIKIIQRFS